jgi:hypothetical protein
MKVSTMGMLRRAADHARKTGDIGLAYVLLEFGNNLRSVMRGEETLVEFNKVYVGADGEPFDLDALCPVPLDA